MPKVISVLSPKGGSGASIITANMSIYLAQKGKKVLLIDAAPNGGCLHNYMNIPYYAAKSEASDHFSILPLIPTDYHNLKFFSNLRPLLGTSSIADYLIKWQAELKQSDFDFVFIDLGSNIDEDVIAVTDIVDFNIVFTNPDPVSIEKTNLLMKMLFNNRLKTFEDKNKLHGVIQNIKRAQTEMMFTPRNLLLLLSEQVPKMRQAIAEIVKEISIGIVFNNVRTISDEELIDFYPHVVKNYFGFDVKSIGEISYSELLANASAMVMPVVTNERSSEFIEILSLIDRRLSDFVSKDSRKNSSQAITPLNYYEMMALDKGSVISDIKKQYEKIKRIYSPGHPLMRVLFDIEELYLYNVLLENVYDTLISPEGRKEYDMEIDIFSESLRASFPESFDIKSLIKKYHKLKKSDTKFIKRDIFGREAETDTDIDVEHIETNQIFEQMAGETITGDKLRILREKAGISLKTMSEHTRISLFVIRAIEDDNYSQLPNIVYIKGFLKLYCRALKLTDEYTEKVINDFTSVMKGEKRVYNYTQE